MPEGLTCFECDAFDPEPQVRKGIWTCPSCELVFDLRKLFDDEELEELDFDA